MSRRWIVNASPVILLAKVGRAGLLPSLAAALVIPAGAAEEINEGPDDDPGRLWLRAHGASHLIGVDAIHPKVAGWDLGRGESEVLTLGYQLPGSEVILDDRAARNCAASLGIPVRGTIGVILLAKQEGLLDAVGPVLHQLQEAGMRVDRSLVSTALRLAGEE